MKFTLILTLVIVAFYACTNNAAMTEAKNKNLLHNNHLSKEDADKRAFIDKVISDKENYTTLQWLDSPYQELGNIKEGEVAEITWRFKNTGNKPLIIANTNAACGCTVAERPEQPILPGKEGRIKATFNSKGQYGMYRRGVDVLANTKNGNLHALSFGVKVEKQPS